MKEEKQEKEAARKQGKQSKSETDSVYLLSFFSPLSLLADWGQFSAINQV